MRRIRKEKHITQENLAELCDTNTAYIGQIETHKRFPSINFIEKIASALEVEADELFKNHKKDKLSPSLKQELHDELIKEFDKFLSKTLEIF
ncbi:MULTISPECIES: helix-turn-helix domain-containing protein [unclassified Treponema]|uniref:helix-turn-helix domain-containing protein n=1 Tax=unclassified Treponema TaxID=2638727 RepID=UPI0020A31647|nr:MULTISPECIES: helix-turn-helix transcriptional regulator [unclassified Treponema]